MTLTTGRLQDLLAAVAQVAADVRRVADAVERLAGSRARWVVEYPDPMAGCEGEGRGPVVDWRDGEDER